MTARWYRLAIGAVLLGQALVLVWNAWQFDWLRGYDAYANDLYARIVSSEQRLPSESETGAWHTPPLWFALAGALRRLASELGAAQIQRPGQLLAAAAGLATCVIVMLIARELWPERRALHLVALVLAASSPALVRASAMYHPETLAVALATAGSLVAVRGFRTRPTVRTGLAVGALLGLAALTRAWALPVLVALAAVFLAESVRSRRWAPTISLVAASLVLVGPWLVNQQLAHGDALAFNRPAPAGALIERRPASFYLGPRLIRVFDHPITPLFRNELVPHLYADWWGDWALTWDSPPVPTHAQLLPPHVVAERARQSIAGLLPTLLALAGVVALAIVAIRERSPRSPSSRSAPSPSPSRTCSSQSGSRRPTVTPSRRRISSWRCRRPPSAQRSSSTRSDHAAGHGTSRWRVALVVLVAVQLPFLVL